MRNVIVILVVMIGLIAWWQWPGHHEQSPATAAQRTAATAPMGSPTTPAAKTVRRLDPDQRKQLEQQIEAAIKKSQQAQQQAAGAKPTLDGDPTIPLEAVGGPLKDALNASIPLLADCYEKAAPAAKTAAASMTMISDPDLGTVIDNAVMTDAEGKPLARELDTCLRDVIDSLALPPLGQPGKLQVQYTFRFD